jgi:thiosulfate dehydrogenase [quinone] large subunit
MATRPATHASSTSAWTEPVTMDADGRIRLPRAGAVAAALLRIGLGLLYLWAFLSQGLGIGYSNTSEADATAANPSYGWHFDYDADAGWITSGFAHSPTEGYTGGAHGPTSFVKDLPVGMVDFIWIFALAGLGIALTFGVFSNIAGWGGLILNVFIWFAGFPPSSNPLIDGEHMAFALSIFLLMWIHASNYFGLGRWWRARTPAILH